MWGRRSIPGARPAAMVIGLAAIWSFSSVAEILTPNEGAKVAWGQVSIAPIILIPVGWFLMSIALAWPGLLHRRWVIAAILALPVLTILVEFTNPLHHLGWSDATIVSSLGISVFQYERGPWFLVKIAHSYLFFLVGTVFILRWVLRSRGENRKQAWYVLGAGLPPFCASVMYVTGIPPFEVVDPTPYSFIASGLILLLGIQQDSVFGVLRDAREALAQRTQDTVIVSDVAFNIVNANPAAVTLLGADAQGMAGRHICELLQPGGGHGACKPENAQMLLEYDPHPEKETRFLEISSSGLRNDATHQEGTIEGHLSVIRDVTGLVKVERELLFRKALLEDISESAPDGILVVSESGQWLQFNRRMREIWQLGSKAVITRQEALQAARKLVKDPDEFFRRLEEIRSQPNVTLRDKIEMNDNRVYERYTSAIVDSNGTRYGRIWFYRDITEAELANEYASRIGRLTAINAVSRAISFVSTVEEIGYRSLAALCSHMNADSGQLFLTDSDTDGAAIASFSDMSPDAEISPDSCIPAVGIGNPVSWCKHGSTVAVALTINQLIIGKITISTARHDGMSEADPELLQAIASQTALALARAKTLQSLERANQELSEARELAHRQERFSALGAMASGIAHDINNSLSPVVGFSEMLLNRKEQYDERTQKFLSIIRTAALDVTHIVERMREFYRERNTDSDVETVTIKPLLNEVILLTSPRWRGLAMKERREIKIATKIASRVPPIPGIPYEVREALINLVINASDAMPDGGLITLAAYPLFPEGADPDTADPDRLAVEVIDTGTGMDAETASKVLQPFFSTKGDKGTGLGLTMVHGVMQRHKGTVEIESTPGEGTRIRLVFPATVDALSVVAHQPMATPIPALKVLVVDDEPVIRELLTDMLMADGHTVTAAPSGSDAISTFENALGTDDFFNLVITDLTMPGMDGHDLAEAVKLASPSTPVIILTGWADRGDGDAPEAGKADAVLSKPPRIAHIRNQIRQLLYLDIEINDAGDESVA